MNERKYLAMSETSQAAIDYQAAFDAIVADPRYQRNLDWGEPRPGHPEGTVRSHIAELERNLEVLRAKFDETDVCKLRLLIHTHDSFKADAKTSIAITDPASHASLARAFLAEFCSDTDLLEMVQFHDEPFALWRQVESKGKYNQERLHTLIHKIKDWNLFLAFNIVDGCTEGKSRQPLRWIFSEVKGKVESRVTEADLIESVSPE